MVQDNTWQTGDQDLALHKHTQNLHENPCESLCPPNPFPCLQETAGSCSKDKTLPKIF